MSDTYTLVCDDCKEKQWSGQRSGQDHYLYDGAEKFLFDHAHHKLRLLLDSAYDEFEPAYGYKSVEISKDVLP